MRGLALRLRRFLSRGEDDSLVAGSRHHIGGNNVFRCDLDDSVGYAEVR
jgi:hypothetical protein